LDLRRIPPAVLVALGLEACGETVSTCLSMMLTSEDDGGTSGTDASSDSPTESDVGPCLGQIPTTDDGQVDTSSTGAGSTDSTGTSGTGTSTSDSGSDDGAETSTSVCLAPPPDAPPPDDDDDATAAPARASGWHASFTRVAAKLPADVAARLRPGAKKDGER
jgi:hypothetical protein